MHKILIDHSLRRSRAHRLFLQSRQAGLEHLEQLFLSQMGGLETGFVRASIDQTPLPRNHQENEAVIDQHLEPGLFSGYQLNEFARGDVEKCFGEDYSVFRGRRLPRIPNGDFLFMSRVVKIGGKPYELSQPASIEVEYDVPGDAWYFQDNDFARLPYAILMETALQPCGFLTAYLRTPLLSPNIEYYFRNLDGSSRLLKEMDLRNKVITAKARLISSVDGAGIIIQKFAFELIADGTTFFIGQTTFGFFTGATMEKQAGLDGGKRTRPGLFASPGAAASGQTRFYEENFMQPSRPYFTLPHRQLRFLDEIYFQPGDGFKSEPIVYANKRIDPGDWFYKRHFYQDAVMPGSLGVEAVFEAMKAYAIARNIGSGFQSPRFGLQTGQEMQWTYRGQITPANQKMELEVKISQTNASPEQVAIRGDASLWVDGIRIYEIKNATLIIKEGYHER